MSLIEVKVPDIGDFSGIDVIEVNVKLGDVIEEEQTLMTVESDKASMEVPSDLAGTVMEIKIKAGRQGLARRRDRARRSGGGRGR